MLALGSSLPRTQYSHNATNKSTTPTGPGPTFARTSKATYPTTSSGPLATQRFATDNTTAHPATGAAHPPTSTTLLHPIAAPPSYHTIPTVRTTDRGRPIHHTLAQPMTVALLHPQDKQPPQHSPTRAQTAQAITVLPTATVSSALPARQPFPPPPFARHTI